jgi:uroporphyrinogen decarboxylase
MTPRQRVLAALRHEEVDQVPWIEGIVGNGIASAVCGEPIRVDWSVYRSHILPKEKAVAATFTRPLITHSDGDMTPLLDAWLDIGQQAIHPLQPDVMDIQSVKHRYGGRVALVGNIFMSDLVHKTPAEIEAQVRLRMETIGAGGGYIMSSSNSLTDDMKPENVLAMRDAVRKYGRPARPLPPRAAGEEVL